MYELLPRGLVPIGVEAQQGDLGRRLLGHGVLHLTLDEVNAVQRVARAGEVFLDLLA